jgi:HD-GYP domain-containing protein (c-di-GMP phosphodiesterase class II)
MKSILANPDAMLWLSKIRNEDQYTSEHCFNVCILSLILGKHLGLSGNDLVDLGVCGMLHDVGKMKISPDILNKEGDLTDEEFQIMKTHTTHGRNILLANSNMLPAAIDVAFGHHEAVDGSGYPRGLPSTNISDFCRIIQVCDVYDAITSLRVYKKPQSSLTALKALYDNRGTKFDKNFVEQFIECIGLYPPGSVVELVDGEIALVLSTNYSNRRLPKILIVRDIKKMPCQERVVDLSILPKGTDVAPLLIKTTLPNGSYGVRLEEFVKKGLKVG